MALKKASKRSISMMATVAIIFNIFAPVANAEFQDLRPDHWGYSKIIDFAERGYFKGYEDNTFKPDTFVTRAEFVQAVNNYFGFTGNEEKTAEFSDLNVKKWYNNAINEAVARGYISGYEDGTFRPSEFITRQEAILVLAKILNIADNDIPKDDEEYLEQYSDYEEIADWAKKSVYNYAVREFIKGYEDGTLRPTRYVSRAELVYLLNTIEEKIIIEENKTSGGSSGKSHSSGGGSSSSRATYYTVNVTVGENGTAIPNSASVRKGNNITITIMPNANYKANVKDNGVDVTEKVVDNKYTITNVNEMHKVEITFVTEPSVSPSTTLSTDPSTEPSVSPSTTPSTDPSTEPSVSPSTIPSPSSSTEPEDECTCGESMKELINLIKEIADSHIDSIIEEIENAKGDAEKIKEIFEKWLGEKIENSEYKDEIEALITKIKENSDKISEELKEEIKKIIYSEVVKDIISKIDDKIDKDKLKEIIDMIKNNAEISADKAKEIIEKIIENHDCEKVQEAIEKAIDFLEDLKEKEEKIDKIIEELSKELGVKKEELKRIVKKVLEDGQTKLEDLKDKILEELKNRIEEELEKLPTEDDVKKALEELKGKIEEELNKLPTEEQIKNEIEKALEDLKDKVEEKLPTEDEVKDELKKIFEDLKGEVSDKLPTDEEIKGWLEGLEEELPNIGDLIKDELIKEIANKIGIKAETLEKILEELKNNEELQEKLEEFIKDKIVEEIVNALSDNDTVKEILNKIYEKTYKDVVDLLLKVLENEEFGDVVAKIILSNSELKDVLKVIDKKITDNTISEENLTTIVSLVTDYYGIVEVIKAIDYKDNTELDNAKEILKIALKNAGVDGIAKLALDGEAIKIISSYFNVFELTEILGENGKDIINGIWSNLSWDELNAMLKEFIKDPSKLEEIKKVINGRFTTTTVTYDANKPSNAKNRIVEGSTDNSSHKDGKSAKLTENGFKLEGYTFIGWAKSKDATESEFDLAKEYKSIDFDYEKEVTLYAIWKADAHKITVDSSNFEKNKVEVKESAVTDEEVEVKISIEKGYKLVEIKANDKTITSSSGKYTFVMPAFDVKITAEFSSTSHSINLDEDINGKIDVVESAEEGKPVTIKAKEGYKIKNLNVNDEPIKENNGEYSFTMPNADVTITGEVVAVYKVEIAEGLEDEIKVDKSNGIEEGETVTVTISEGYKLKEGTLKYNDAEIKYNDGNYTFEMPAFDVKITAEFIYTITANAKDGTVIILKDLETIKSNGNIRDLLKSLTSINEAEAGEKMYVLLPGLYMGKLLPKQYSAKKISKITPTDLTLTKLDIDIDKIGDIYEFTMPKENVEITAEFTK